MTKRLLSGNERTPFFKLSTSLLQRGQYIRNWIEKLEFLNLICTYIFNLEPLSCEATYRACCPPRPSPILAKKSDCFFCRPPENADEMEANGRLICCSIFVSTYSKQAEPFANPVITVSATISTYGHCEAQIKYGLPHHTRIRPFLANLKHEITTKYVTNLLFSFWPSPPP